MTCRHLSHRGLFLFRLGRDLLACPLASTRRSVSRASHRHRRDRLRIYRHCGMRYQRCAERPAVSRVKHRLSVLVRVGPYPGLTANCSDASRLSLVVTVVEF